MPAESPDPEFTHDVFLSHSSKDKPVVRALAERLRGDGVRVWFDEWEIKPGDSIFSKVEEGLEKSRVLVLCMSEHAFGSDWATLESQTFRFRDPLNKQRRFLPLKLDNTLPKGTLAQFLYLDWSTVVEREAGYPRLLEAVSTPQSPQVTIRSQAKSTEMAGAITAYAFELTGAGIIWGVAFSYDGRYVLSGGDDGMVRVWEVATGDCLCVLEGHNALILGVAFSYDGRFALSGGYDNTVRVWEVATGNCLRVLEGHVTPIYGVAFSHDGRYVLSGGHDSTVRVWEVGSGDCLHALEGHAGIIWGVAFSQDGRFALSGGYDNTVRLWEVATGDCVYVLEGHTGSISGVAFSHDGRFALSGSDDYTIRVWDVATGNCLHVLEGHTGSIWGLAFSHNDRFVLSGSQDSTVRFWEVTTSTCLRVLEGHIAPVYGVAFSPDGRFAFSGGSDGTIRTWDLQTSAQYTNAKVLLVGDTSSGKTGLAHRLATNKWQPSDGSTVGAWSTQWALPGVEATGELQREIWLWDFGGQADQRLVHQLFLDRAALILLLFDADKEDVLPGLREWLTALRRSVPKDTPLVLVAGRTDAGFRASRAKVKAFADAEGYRYFETSAKDGTNCAELSEAILETIAWDDQEKRSSPAIFKRIKDEILKLRDEGQVLHTFKELRDLLERRLPVEERFTDDTLKTVVGLLDGPGVVKELDYGTYVLLQPEWVNAYAQAVIRTLRSDPTEMGCLPLRSIEEGRLLFQVVERDGKITEAKRLPTQDERIVLREMERQMEARGLCLRQGDRLVFPSHCGRERPARNEFPTLVIRYTVRGYLDDIYACLVVMLANSGAFTLKDLWREAADFETLAGKHHMGVRMMRDESGSGEFSLYFAPDVTPAEQVIFANYVHGHLLKNSESAERRREWVCPKCGTPKGNSAVLEEKLQERGEEAKTLCDRCDTVFPLWDELEVLFARDDLREKVAALQRMDARELDSRRKGKLLALEVESRFTSADQKCFQIPATEDEGLDVEVEFTDEGGQGTGKRLYLQLKSGNSHLEKRKSDGVEIFRIKDQRWVDYWLKQPHPVMLVIGTLPDSDDRRRMARDKAEFADVRWMEISSVLRAASAGGTKAVKQIEFMGERLDRVSIERWKRRVLAGA